MNKQEMKDIPVETSKQLSRLHEVLEGNHSDQIKEWAMSKINMILDCWFNAPIVSVESRRGSE